MSDYSELKRLAEAALRNWPDSKLFERPECERFIDASRPDVVLSLIAETDELGRYLCTCRDCGGEGSLHTGDWHSYGHMEPPEPVMEKCGECDGTGLIGEIQDLYQVITERDQLKAENEALRKDAERYRLILDECRGYLTCVVDSSMSRNNAEALASELLEAIDAMGKGEQS